MQPPDPDPGDIRVFAVTRADIDACPIGSLLPSHYRDDGSCRCYEDDEMPLWVTAVLAAFACAGALLLAALVVRLIIQALTGN